MLFEILYVTKKQQNLCIIIKKQGFCQFAINYLFPEIEETTCREESYINSTTQQRYLLEVLQGWQ